jgi:type IV pilus assembly protein PilY1
MLHRPVALLLAAALGLTASALYAAPTEIDNAPLPSTREDPGQVKPNILFIFDNSRSMATQGTPDHVGGGAITSIGALRACKDSGDDADEQIERCLVGDPPYMSPDFNYQYYNPEIRYFPPVNADGSEFPTLNRLQTRGWTIVLNDGFRVQNNDMRGVPGTSVDLTRQFPDRKWCSAVDQRNCSFNSQFTDYALPHSTVASPVAGAYDPIANNRRHIGLVDPDGSGPRPPEPIYRGGTPYYYRLRPTVWCTTADLITCVNSTGPTGPNIFPALVRWCDSATGGTCNAKQNGSKVFGRFGRTTIDLRLPTGTTHGTVLPGFHNFVRTNLIDDGSTFTDGLGSPRKSPRRNDCAGSVCTYDEEMTNFAHWYAYYRTRAQMLKTAASLAFQSLDRSYRVGFMTVTPRADTDPPGQAVTSNFYLRIDDFRDSHKTEWFRKLFSQSVSNGGLTPLRAALARAGRLYAGKFDAINTGIPGDDDPILASCQQNFAILGTDGYWNSDPGKQLNGSSDMGNVDSAVGTPRPLFDGGAGRGATGTLADVALYYYDTDLRPGGSTNARGDDVSKNNVRTTQTDPQSQQHMTTFTFGMGVDGLLRYDPNYLEATSGDFVEIKNGTRQWPVPRQNDPTAVDDLWHAAVNGHGVYFSARNPLEMVNGLKGALAGLQEQVGAGAAAATSNLQPVAGDNFAFTAQYRTVFWDGDLVARTIDLDSGIVSRRSLWSASGKLDDLVRASGHTGRTIHTFSRPGSSRNFDYSSLAGIGADRHFFLRRLNSLDPGIVSSYSDSAGADRMINYLRGDRRFETTGRGLVTDLFRNREHLLGDAVGSQPAYVKKSPLAYNPDLPGNTDHDEFRAETANRRGTVYVGTNDGMLHAFETDNGEPPFFQLTGITTDTTADDTFSGRDLPENGRERWAYIPGIVLPEMYQLAEIDYEHAFYVDGNIQVGDTCFDRCSNRNDWRTILVAGLNAGGRGYFALDITATPGQHDNFTPLPLWEFTATSACRSDSDINAGARNDCHMGLSFGSPIITKLSDGNKWVVMLSSGHNNFNPGDGRGYLYILEAESGRTIARVSTGVGTGGTAARGYADANPSGFTRIANFVRDSANDNTTVNVYGGDLFGNLFRIETQHEISPGERNPNYLRAIKIAELRDSGGNPQPVTSKPEIGLVTVGGVDFPVILLGTGRYLGLSDLADRQRQTVYAIRDDLSETPDLVTRANLVQQIIVENPAEVDTRTVEAPSAVEWNSSARGWYADLPETGERVNVDPKLQLGIFVVASNVPVLGGCESGGHGWINFFDFKTGSFVETSPNQRLSLKIASSLIVGINVIKLPGGNVSTIVTTADNQQLTKDPPPPPAGFAGARVLWRELAE